MRFSSTVRRRGSRRGFAALHQTVAVADLQIPAVRILHVEALEVVADHVRPGLQTALLELGLHALGVPLVDAVGHVVDDAGDRRWRRLSARCTGVRLAPVPDDDLADVADLHRALVLAVVVPDLPAHEIAVEGGALAVVGDGVGNVIEPDGLERRRRRRGGDGRDTPLRQRGTGRRGGDRRQREALYELPPRHLAALEVGQQTSDHGLHTASTKLVSW